MSEIAKTVCVTGAYLLNKHAGMRSYDDVATLVRIIQDMETRLASARAEGFAEAREMATKLAEEAAGKEIATRPTGRFARNMSETRELALAALADDIRAMQDEGGQ